MAMDNTLRVIARLKQHYQQRFIVNRRQPFVISSSSSLLLLQQSVATSCGGCIRSITRRSSSIGSNSCCAVPHTRRTILSSTSVNGTTTTKSLQQQLHHRCYSRSFCDNHTNYHGSSNGNVYTTIKNTHQPQKRSFHFATNDYSNHFMKQQQQVSAVVVDTTNNINNGSNYIEMRATDTASISSPNNDDDNNVFRREQALHYCNHIYDPQGWLNDPIVSLVNGEKLLPPDSSETTVTDDTMIDAASSSGSMVDTYNAVGVVNGKQYLANRTQIAYIQSHIESLHKIWSSNSTDPTASNKNDLRKRIRHVEDQILTRHVGYLIGNQCMDFYKQDGVTEIEEAIAVNRIEREMNDALLQQEQAGMVNINRQPIYVSTVSNFTNFLDLCRKVLRSIEVGIPVIVLCRPNYTVTQHSYRWVQLLIDLSYDVGIDPNMITYVSASMHDIQSILRVCEHSTGNLYATCSRTVATELMNVYPKTIASTSGPNTLVCTSWDITTGDTKQMGQAIADSATIESSGQCTALRHCIVPTSISDSDCTKLLLDNITTILSPVTALSESQYAGIIVPPSTTTKANNAAAGATANNNTAIVQQQLLTDEYQRLDTRLRHNDVDVYVRICNDTESSDGGGSGSLISKSMPEYWRKVVVDFTKLDLVQNKYITQGKIQIRPIDENAVNKLASWLNLHQPISLAINGPRHESIKVGIAIWERTALVVYTIGSTDHETISMMPPAMTCQARPQDGECFGEFPPRNSMNQYTIFPVIIPSSNPSYDTTYNETYLQTRGLELSDYMNQSTKNFLSAITDDATRGYCALIIEYLQNACRKNPKLGSSETRSVLYGIQRPPLHMKTMLRCTQYATYNDFAMIYILFQVTNARNQAEISIHTDNAHMIKICQQLKIPITIQSDVDFTSQCEPRTDIFHTVTISGAMMSSSSSRFPMVGTFVSLYLPFGHIKSTMFNDDVFEVNVRMSDKWLNTLF